eukprot:2706137-Karenia_brevis.AAC.1
MSCNFNEFYASLNAWSGGLIEDLRNVPGIIYAGGAVLAALVGCNAGDLDIFLVRAEEPERCLRDVFDAVQKNQMRRLGPKDSKMLVTRSKNAITFFRIAGGKTVEVPVQLITTLYESTLDLLIGFDIDSCCFALEPDKKRVVCTPRGQRAMRYGVNIADTALSGPNYCRRLEKYAGRGYAIAVPGFLPARVSKHIWSAQYIHLQTYDILMKTEAKIPHNKDMEITVPRFHGVRMEKCDSVK